MSQVRGAPKSDMPANPANQPRPDRRLCNRVRSKTCMLGEGDDETGDWLTVEFEDETSTSIVNPSGRPTNAIDGQKGSHTDCWVFVDDSEVKAATALMMAAMERKGHIEKNSDSFVHQRGGTPSDRSEGSACEHEDFSSLDEEGEEDCYTSTEDEDENGH